MCKGLGSKQQAPVLAWWSRCQALALLVAARAPLCAPPPLPAGVWQGPRGLQGAAGLEAAAGQEAGGALLMGQRPEAPQAPLGGETSGAQGAAVGQLAQGRWRPAPASRAGGGQGAACYSGGVWLWFRRGLCCDGGAALRGGRRRRFLQVAVVVLTGGGRGKRCRNEHCPSAGASPFAFLLCFCGVQQLVWSAWQAGAVTGRVDCMNE